MKILITIVFFVFSFSLFGQEKSDRDMIYLKNGSIFIGELTAYDKNEITFVMPNGLLVTFNKREVKKIIIAGQDYEQEEKVRKQKPVVIKEYPKRGIYNITYGSLNSGSNAFNGGLIGGVGLDNITGKQFNKYVGLGLGIGYHSMNPGRGENNLPLFVDFRGYLKERKVSPYYNLSAGYAFAFKNEEKRINDAQGGFVFHPAFGFKIGSAENSFMIDFGIKWTRSTFHFDFWNEVREHKMTYERLVLRIGLML